jgi:hydrogenase-4 component B
MVSFPVWISDSFSISVMVAALVAVVAGKRLQALFHIVTFAAGCLLVGEALCGWQFPGTWHAASPLGFGFFPIQFKIDALSALMVGLLGVQIVAVSLFAPGYLKYLGTKINANQYWASFFLFLFSMAAVFLSADAISFIVFWELMALSSASLVASDHKQHKVQEATLIYVGATRVATAFLGAGFLWMHSLSHSWEFASWSFSDASTWWPALFILIGFAIKAGLWPFHLWLPYAYPAAPAPVTALMSGSMSKIAIYGIIRLLVMTNLDCVPIAYFLLFVGTVSSFWGVLFSIVQVDLKRLLAYSSVENIGLICMGIAIAMLSRINGLYEIAGIALTGALLHAVNHGIIKSLLFMSAGAVDSQAHTRDMNHLGGLGQRMPFTMVAFFVGSAAMCALPPLNGFASKWLLYQSLFRTAFESHSLVDRSIAFGAITVLALVGGLAVTAFTKAVGTVFLGRPRGSGAQNATEGNIGTIAAQFVGASLCVLIGVMMTYAVRLLNPLVVSIFGGQASTATDAIDMPMGTIALCLAFLVLVIYGIVLKTSRVRKFITWDCGFGETTARAQVSAESYSQPVAWIFKPLLRYRLAIKIRGTDRRHFPEYISIEPRMVSLLEKQVYRPAIALLEGCSKVLAKVQAGSIHLYLLYVCMTLIALLFIGINL